MAVFNDISIENIKLFLQEYMSIVYCTLPYQVLSAKPRIMYVFTDTETYDRVSSYS
jgi:hypothetical protein